jgi:phosphatidylglycerophosphatase A
MGTGRPYQAKVAAGELRRDWSFWLATWFGIGLLRPGPGTLAALTMLPVDWLLFSVDARLYGLAVAGLVVIGIASSAAVARSTGEQDPQIIVVDEVAGALLALWLAGNASPWAPFVAVALFRLFDIWKPWPINRVEHLNPPGLGVMADDLCAGLAAGLITFALF